MLGRIRASPSPIELLELERFPSKFHKDDSLSIYETTLEKLKQGSKRSLKSEHNLSPMNLELSSNSSEDSDSDPLTVSGPGMISSPNQEHKRGREMSIRYLFSKYASSHPKPGLNSSNNGYGVNVLASSSDSESIGCSGLTGDENFVC